jgi:hypothetical protein
VAGDLAGEQPLHVADGLDGLAAEGDDDVLGPDTRPCRGAAVDHPGDLDAPAPAQPVGHPRGQGPAAAGEPELGTMDAAAGDQSADDGVGGGIERDGHAQALPDARSDDRGVDADDPGVAGGERAAAVPGVQSGVGLDDALDDARTPPVHGRQRSPQGRDHAGRHRPGIAKGAADGDHQLPDPQPSGVAELRPRQLGGGGDAHHREI